MMDLVEVERPDDVAGRAPQGNTIAGGYLANLVHCRAGKDSAMWRRVVSSKRPSISAMAGWGSPITWLKHSETISTRT